MFYAGNLDFRRSSYQRLVVDQSGARAQFKGSGTINGNGDFQFMLWAIDGLSDMFRIQITDDIGKVVYDNVTGSEGGQPIIGGSIIVHK